MGGAQLGCATKRGRCSRVGSPAQDPSGLRWRSWAQTAGSSRRPETRTGGGAERFMWESAPHTGGGAAAQPMQPIQPSPARRVLKVVVAGGLPLIPPPSPPGARAGHVRSRCSG